MTIGGLLHTQQIEPDKAVVTLRNHSSFANDVLKLVSGTTIAMVLGVLAAPFLTRLYAPEAFGVLALFTSITGILNVIACMRYELSIMLPEGDEEAANLLGVSLCFVVLVSMLTVPFVWWGREPFSEWVNMPQLAPYLWLVPPAVFMAGLFLALNNWNSRTKHFGRLSLARLTTSVASTSATLGVGYIGYATGGAMIVASLAGQTIASAVLTSQIWLNDRQLFIRHIRWRQMLFGFKRHRKFLLYSTWSALLNTASWQMPPFILSAFFSSTVVGYYALGLRILQLPMNLIGNAIGQVFYQRAAEARIRGTLTALMENTFRQLVMFGLFPMLVLSVIGKDLYTVVFGDNWSEAGIYSQILSPWAFFWFIATPLSHITNVLEKQQFGIYWNASLFSLRIISLAIGGYIGNVYLCLGLFAFTGMCMYISLLVIESNWLGISCTQLAKIMLSNIIIILPLLTPLLLVKFLIRDSFSVVCVAVFLGLVYAIYLWNRNFGLQTWLLKGMKLIRQ